MRLPEAIRFSSRLYPGLIQSARHDDKTPGVAVRCVADRRRLGSGHFRPVGPEFAQDVQRSRVADASVPAGVIRLLLAGHGGIQGGHLQWLRGGRQRAAAADRRSQSGPEEEGFENVNAAQDFAQTQKTDKKCSSDVHNEENLKF